jgi:hypothetical protein
MSTGVIAKRIGTPKLKAFRDLYDKPVTILLGFAHSVTAERQA